MKMPTIDGASDENGWDHTRLTHSKFVSADGTNCAITTSNWTGDFFENTAGLTLVSWNDAPLCQQLSQVMDRDLGTGYAPEIGKK